MFLYLDYLLKGIPEEKSLTKYMYEEGFSTGV